MNEMQLKKIKIISNLSMVPMNRLEEVQRFIEYILYTTRAQKKKPISVRGIWENKGFEKIDIEKELKTLRNEIQQNLDRKEFD
jgi:hypothetical protein